MELSYLSLVDDYKGKVTTPVLYDKKNKEIVSNDSSNILRMFNSEFNEFCETPEQKVLDLYPSHLRQEIDAVVDWVHP